MHRNAGSILLSATDLVGHLNCRHLTHLDLAVADGTLSKPIIWDPLLEILVERGSLHEQGFVDHLMAAGYGITVVDGVGVDPTSIAQTFSAMKAGAQVIVQGALRADHWRTRRYP